MAYYGLTKTRVLSWAKKAGIIGVPVGTLIFLYAYAIPSVGCGFHEWIKLKDWKC